MYSRNLYRKEQKNPYSRSDKQSKKENERKNMSRQLNPLLNLEKQEIEVQELYINGRKKLPLNK